jgi:hypothetical protein
MIRKIIGLLPTAAAFASFATFAQAAEPSAPEPTAAPAGGPLVAYWVSHDPPRFAVTSLLSLEFGTLNSPVALAHGDSIVAAYHVEDPADFIASAVARDLAAKLGGDAPVKLEGIQSLKDFDPSRGRYLVIARTESWGFDFFTLQPSLYRAVLGATVSIRDNRTHKEIAKGGCWAYGKNPDGAPTGKEVLANDGARLKTMLAEQAVDCVSQIEKRVLQAI